MSISPQLWMFKDPKPESKKLCVSIQTPSHDQPRYRHPEASALHIQVRVNLRPKVPVLQELPPKQLVR